MYLHRGRGRNVWQIRWTVNGRKVRCSTGTADLAQAERILSAMREGARQRQDGRSVERLLRALYGARQSGLPLASVVDEYLAAAPATRHTALAAAHWRAFVRWVQVHRPGVASLADLDAAACRAYVSVLRGAPKTVANTVGDCASVYRAVAPLHGVSADPWRGIRVQRAPARAARDLTADEVRRLLAATTGEYHGAVLVALYTGLRYHDVAKLRWECVHADAIRLAPLKTEKHGTRVAIPLHQDLAAYLAALDRSGPYVFPELADTYDSRPRYTARRFGYARRAAGLPSSVTFHSLRHTFISAMRSLGAPDVVTRKLVGHTTAQMTDRYDHSLTQERAAVDRLPSYGA